MKGSPSMGLNPGKWLKEHAQLIYSSFWMGRDDHWEQGAAEVLCPMEGGNRRESSVPCDHQGVKD